MKDKEQSISVILIIEENDIERVSNSINNLVANGLTKDELMVAIKAQEETEEIKNLCNECEIKYYEYENLQQVYFELPQTLCFDYISFIKEGYKYTKNFKEKAKKHFTKRNDNIYVCPIKRGKDKYILNKNIEKDKTIDIEKNPSKIWIHLESAFISKELISRIKKPETENLQYYLSNNLLIKLIDLNGGYSIMRNIKLVSPKKLEDAPEGKIENYDILWYENIFNNIQDVTSFSKREFGTLLRFNQYVYMYMLKNIINENVNMKNKHILKGENLNKFYCNVKKFLKEIEDDIIMETVGNKSVNYYLLKLKNELENKAIEYREFCNKIHVVNKDKILFNAEDIKIKILLMDYVDNELVITATYPFPFEEEKLKIYAEYMGNKYYATKNELYSKYKSFGKVLYENYTFDIKIPLEEQECKQYIGFFVESNKSNVSLKINFSKPLSRLSKLKSSYWNCGKFTLNCRKQKILVMKNSKMRHIKREVKYIKSLLKSKNKTRKKAGYLRIIYNITKPFFKKEIWLFEDKIYKGGDNGEYLYTYASKQKDGIKKYYILKKGCIDAKRFKKEHKRFVEFGSLKHKLLFLNANIVFTTHNNCVKHHSFDEKTEIYFRDLFNSINMCIQHGLTVQYIPHLTNRINDNLKKFFLASPIEEKNMKNKEYAYKEHLDVLKITGSPRYDGLKNNDKKQILITPTWRSYLALPVLRMAESRRRNSDFKKSEYFRIYNELINDKRLIDCASKYGYKIIYLLHPCTSPQIEDFDKNEFVELIAATDDLNYEKILTESSLMVTDYSGVQFDFAYMYKPIIYFHPNELPPSYEEGEYKYETMALGEITKDIKQTVDLLCEYMENDCKIKEKYKSRIDEFFKYHDDNNCKRIYDEVINLKKKGENL